MKIQQFKNTVFLISLCFTCSIKSVFSQINIKKDTVYVNDKSFEETAIYGAKDSIFFDVKKNVIYLFGEAYLDFMGSKMNAGYLEVDLSKNEVFASYTFDKDSNKVEFPIFNSEGEEMKASKIRYNFKTEKGFIEEVKIKQDELFLHMETAKRHQNENTHFKNGKFTTCELDEPHYHFHLSKAVMVPNKRIVTGPMNLWIKGVPTPFGLPFSIIPQSKTRTHGILFPQIIPASFYGFGVRDLGYYFPINNSLNTSSYLTLYSRGTWGFKQDLNYNYLYKSRGALSFELQQLKSGFPNFQKNNKLSFRWSHQKDAKSNPYWTFSSNVNFISDNNTQNDINQQSDQFLNNQLNSDINITKNFPGKPYRMGLKINARQNTSNNQISLQSPTYNFNVNRVSPFKNIIKSKNEFAQFFARIGLTYNLESRNESTFIDSLASTDLLQNFKNGIQQNTTIQSTAGFFKNTLKFNPSITYNNHINFQQIEKNYDSITNSVINNRINKTGISHNISYNASLTTVMYNYYRLVGKSKPLIRHLITPSVNFSYRPNLNTLQTLDTGTVDLQTITYTGFEESLYRQSITQDQGLITFGINNTMELKVASDKDTVTGFRKIRILDGFSINGNYDFFKDSFNLSDLSMNFRVSPFPYINFVISSNYSPYSWDNNSGKKLNTFAINTNQGLGRILNASFNTVLTLTSKESKTKINNLQSKIGENWNADFNHYFLYPERVINFDIPWKMNFTHTFTLTRNQNISSTNLDEFFLVNTLNTNGDFSFTKRWKILGSINYDIKTNKIAYSTLSLSRDMHCWALTFNWIPIGINKSFLFSLRSKSNMFKDAKLDFRKPPIFF